MKETIALFEIKNISKSYGGEFALRNVSMEIGKGLNFIIGASGSGKTTLLKIISGMEQDFDGEVYYCGKSVNALSEQEKSYYYNHIFGFIWQDFNLIEDLTVAENVALPQYVKDAVDKKVILKILRELKISEIADQKVKSLSGGQKQRVAIARELVKNPQVIIADEPTSALDEKASRNTMDILRDIAKTRTVIVVTHDTSLIDSKAKVYELDKGEMVTYAEPFPTNTNALRKNDTHHLSFRNAFTLAKTNIKSRLGRFVTTSLSLLVAATLLLVTVSGAIIDSGQEAFDKLFTTYGKGILDINIVGSFTSAGGTNGAEKDEPNADVTQDIGGLYEKYLSDERVEYILSAQAFNNIEITVDGEKYEIENSNSSPAVNELTAGTMPMGSGNEVVVPNSFVKRLGLTDDQVIGKPITFHGSIYNWDSGEPILMPVSTEVTIIGVADTTVKYDYEGKLMEYTIDDSFFFSKSALDKMRAQAEITKADANFTIRAKSPSDMISIKEELNAEGIIPLGRFELVEDMVRLNEQTTQQSSSAIIIIGFLSAIVAVSTALISALMRKREYAIYKVSGFAKSHLAVLMSAEFMIVTGLSGALFLLCSPLINLGTTTFWGVNILNLKLLTTGVLLVLAMGVLSFGITVTISASTKAVDSLKTGDR